MAHPYKFPFGCKPLLKPFPRGRVADFCSFHYKNTIEYLINRNLTSPFRGSGGGDKGGGQWVFSYIAIPLKNQYEKVACNADNGGHCHFLFLPVENSSFPYPPEKTSEWLE